MPRVASLADQAVEQERRAQYRVERRVSNRDTFNSRRMWVLVALVWVFAAAVLAVGLNGLR